MCGIAGFIDRERHEALLDHQLGCILHRGPDGEGRFVHDGLQMGMRRLSIIDLAHGWQPLTSRNKRVIAFQNGEIYNYVELRNELRALGYRFKTQSDTEVLAHGYDAWGIDGLLERLDGMYALAIVDLDSGKLHLARDRFGEKPLFYAWETGRLSYGSSLESVLMAPWLEAEIDVNSVERYLATHFIAGRRTIFRGVQRVLPGERLEVDVDAIERPALKRYYRPVLRPTEPATLDEIETLLDRAVRSRLVSDVPVGLFLSGGIDSSLIAAMAHRHANLEAFCVGFDDKGADETPHAQAVADHFGMKLNTFRFDLDSFNSLIPKVCASLDEPIGDQALLPLYWLSQAASEKATVVLSGEGADEAFCGYGYYADELDADIAGDFDEAARLAGRKRGDHGLLVETLFQTQSGFPLLTDRAERERLTPGASGIDSFERDLVAWLARSRTPLQRNSAADLASWLPDDLLVKADRMTMAASIEGRAPFLSPEVVERGLSLPESQKYAGGVSKVILRQLAEKLLPESVVHRRKQGFVLPMDRWLDNWFETQGGFESSMSVAPELGINIKALSKLRRSDPKSSRQRLYFALVVLVEWHRAFKERTKTRVADVAKPKEMAK